MKAIEELEEYIKNIDEFIPPEKCLKPIICDLCGIYQQIKRLKIKYREQEK